MRRLIASFLFAASFAAGPLLADGIDPAQQSYASAYLNSRKAAELEAGGDLRGALSVYQGVAATLAELKQTRPDFQPAMRDWRINQTVEAIDRLQARLGLHSEPAGLFQPESFDLGNGSKPARPAIVETVPPKTGTKAPVRKTEPLKASVDTSDPLKSIQNRIDSLEQQLADANSQLAEASEQLAEAKARNAALSRDLAVMTADRKKAVDLAEIYQSNVLDLKTKGDTNETKAKELEVQLAAAKKLNTRREAELKAAEERIEQLLARSKAVAKKAEPKKSEPIKAPAKIKETAKATPKEAGPEGEEEKPN